MRRQSSPPPAERNRVASRAAEAGERLGTVTGEIVVSTKLLDEGIAIGDEITVDNTDVVLRVVGTVEPTSYGHVPASYTSLKTWRTVQYGTTVPLLAE